MTHKLVICHYDDERFTIVLDGEEMGDFNHDRHGWAGMESAKDLAYRMAEKLEIEVEETYAEEEEA